MRHIGRYALDVLKEATGGYVEPTTELAENMMTPFLNNGAYYLLYMEDKQVKGWIGIGSSYDDFIDQEVGVIVELYVLPLFRKQGIAKKLIEAATEQLKNQGYKKVQLQVFAGNQAKSLYKKLDFQEVVTLMEKEI